MENSEQIEGIRQEIIEGGLRLVKEGLVARTWGNISIRVDETHMLITPSGRTYEDLTPKDIVLVNYHTSKHEGRIKPSSEKELHCEIYRTRRKINAVVHTHSTYAVAWAQAGRSIPVLGTTHADHLHVEIPITEFMTPEMTEGDYEIETGIQIAKLFESISYQEVEMVLVAGHGPFTWGDSPEKAVYNSVILEELAKMAYLSININPQVKPLEEHLIQKHYSRKHGPDSYYGQK